MSGIGHGHSCGRSTVCVPPARRSLAGRAVTRRRIADVASLPGSLDRPRVIVLANDSTTLVGGNAVAHGEAGNSGSGSAEPAAAGDLDSLVRRSAPNLVPRRKCVALIGWPPQGQRIRRRAQNGAGAWRGTARSPDAHRRAHVAAAHGSRPVPRRGDASPRMSKARETALRAPHMWVMARGMAAWQTAWSGSTAWMSWP
jgi:hypothetical protein